MPWLCQAHCRPFLSDSSSHLQSVSWSPPECVCASVRYHLRICGACGAGWHSLAVEPRLTCLQYSFALVLALLINLCCCCCWHIHPFGAGASAAWPGSDLSPAEQCTCLKTNSIVPHAAHALFEAAITKAGRQLRIGPRAFPRSSGPVHFIKLAIVHSWIMFQHHAGWLLPLLCKDAMRAPRCAKPCHIIYLIYLIPIAAISGQPSTHTCCDTTYGLSAASPVHSPILKHAFAFQDAAGPAIHP